jgi:hypothetical protein
MVLVRKAADEIKITIYFLKSFGVNKINEFVVTSNKLTNNFAGWLQVVSGRMQPAWRQQSKSADGNSRSGSEY